jgi:hypothetical protein
VFVIVNEIRAVHVLDGLTSPPLSRLHHICGGGYGDGGSYGEGDDGKDCGGDVQ